MLKSRIRNTAKGSCRKLSLSSFNCVKVFTIYLGFAKRLISLLTIFMFELVNIFRNFLIHVINCTFSVESLSILFNFKIANNLFNITFY